MHAVIASSPASLFLLLLHYIKKRAWYTLSVHASNRPQIVGRVSRLGIEDVNQWQCSLVPREAGDEATLPHPQRGQGRGSIATG
jgi:hypothetical protein